MLKQVNKMVELGEIEIKEALREEFSLGLTGDSYENSANKEMINTIIDSRYKEFRRVIDIVEKYKLNSSLKKILTSLKNNKP